MSPSHFCPAVLLNFTSGSDTPPHDRTCLHSVDVFVWRQMGGGGVTQWHHGSRRQEHHGGICIRRAAPCAVYPVARNKKVEGHSLPVGRKHFVTAQNNMPSERKKKHFDRCVIVVPPRAYFMLTRIALALKMYRVSCCRWQIHFTYRASLCHPSASFYVEA